MQAEILKLMKLKKVPLENPIPYNFDTEMLKKAKENNPVVILGRYTKKKQALISSIIALKIRKQGKVTPTVLSVYPECNGKVIFVDLMLSPVNVSEILFLLNDSRELVISAYDDMQLKQTLGVIPVDRIIADAYLITEG